MKLFLQDLYLQYLTLLIIPILYNYMYQINFYQMNTLSINAMKFLPLIIISFSDILIDNEFIINNTQTYTLIGVVYHGQNHFIS